MPTRSLVLLGASGSVGSSTLRYLRSLSKFHSNQNSTNNIELQAVTVHRSVDQLSSILNEFRSVKLAGLTDEVVFQNERHKLEEQFPAVKFFGGPQGVIDLIQESEADTVLTAIVGAAGMNATVAAIRAGKKIALANKETLVTAGPAIEQEIKLSRHPVSILPVDSEHNAAFQLLEGLSPSRIYKLILTASGGPFRDYSINQMKQVTKEQVLNHPTWKMGPKISVDSASMINKGLELIEAHFLFDLNYSQLDSKIHRSSYVHAMLQTSDGSILLSSSPPDMVFPIAHSLHYPEAVPVRHKPDDDCANWPPLEFESVDVSKYPGFQLAIHAGKQGGTAPAIFNAANEVAVGLFLDGDIEFYRIPEIIDDGLQKIKVENGIELGLFIEADRKTRHYLNQSYSKIRH
ncbi:MAG: 1-deoxy-D-xylulose-5-phosphate reductoisomerase [Leptonema sp. (in: Bacteria)]|nr:1-deoxy-D-xylulose-5-phosphate reductoisomerase [Leptonema sp. (in: bacteria)]